MDLSAAGGRGAPRKRAFLVFRHFATAIALVDESLAAQAHTGDLPLRILGDAAVRLRHDAARRELSEDRGDGPRGPGGYGDRPQGPARCEATSGHFRSPD